MTKALLHPATRRALGGGLLACLFFAGAPARAEVTEQLSETRYPADASQASSLGRALNAASPIRENGQIYHGYTTWRVNWRFWWDERPDGRCKITRVATDLTGTIQLPVLTGASAALQARFGTYLSALRTHELGHFQIGRDAAAAIDRRILALGERASCPALASEANALAERTLAEHRRREQDYDSRTGHGKTQGAWLEE